VRCVGAGQSVVPALRDHGRGGGRGGEVVAGLIFLRGGRDRQVSAARRASGLGGWLRRCRRSTGPSAWAGGYVGGGGAGGPRPGRREPIHGGSGAASMPLTPGRRPPTPPPRTFRWRCGQGPGAPPS